MPWSFVGVTRLSPDPESLDRYYRRLPWSLPFTVAASETPGGLRLELRSNEEGDGRLLRDPDGMELCVLPSPGPEPIDAAVAWFEGISLFSPAGGRLAQFYRGLPGAEIEVEGDGRPLIAIVRLGAARVALFQAPSRHWHLECGIHQASALNSLAGAGFALGAMRHRPWGETSASIRDPEGVEIEFELDDAEIAQESPGG